MKIAVKRAERAALARIARLYDCDVRSILEAAVEDLVRAHARELAPPRRRKTRPVRRPGRVQTSALKTAAQSAPPVKGETGKKPAYPPKSCVLCEAEFQPTGARSLYCPKCRRSGSKSTAVAAPRAPVPARRETDDYVAVSVGGRSLSEVREELARG